MKSVRLGWLAAALLTIAAPAAAQSSSATLSGITCPGSGCLIAEIPQIGQIAIQIEPGLNGTYLFEQKNADATDWLPWDLLPTGGRSRVSFTREPGLFTAETNGVSQYRIRVSQHFSGSALVVYNFLPAGTANVSAQYIIGQASPDLINAQNLGDIATGLLKNTNSGGATPTGTLSRAVPGTDYLAPNGSGVALSGVGLLANPLSQFALTTSAQLASIIVEGRTGTGAVVNANGPTLSSPVLVTPTMAKIANLTTNGIVTTTNGDGTLTVVPPNGIWGTITGTLANQTDLQSALDARQPLDPDLTAIALLTTTSAGRSLLTIANAAAGRIALGVSIGSDVEAWDADLDAIAALASQTNFGRAFLALIDAAAARSYMGVVIGTNVQAWDADLDALAANGSPYYLNRTNHTGTQAWSTITSTPTTIQGYGITNGARLDVADTFTTSGAASMPAFLFTGAPYTGGTGTTTMPLFLFQPTAASAYTGWNTAGGFIGINTASGFTGDYLRFMVNGSFRWRMDQSANMYWSQDDGARFGLAPNGAGFMSRLKLAVTEGGWFGASQYVGWYGSGDTYYGINNIGNSKTTCCTFAYTSGFSSSGTPANIMALQHSERVVAGGNTGAATKTLDFGMASTSGNWYSYTITGNVTFAFASPVTGGHYFMVLTIDGTGGYAQPTWPTMKWDGGSAPTLSMTANKINVIEIWYDGSNYIGKAQVIGG